MRVFQNRAVQVCSYALLAIAVAATALVIYGFTSDRDAYQRIGQNTQVHTLTATGELDPDHFIDISSMTTEQAKAAIESFAQEQKAPVIITFTYEDKAFDFDMSDKVTFDVEAVVSQALKINQGTTYLDRIPAQIKAAFGNKGEAHEVKLAYQIDDSELASYIDSLAPEIHVDPIKGEREFHDDNTVTWGIDKPGLALDESATITAAQEQLDQFNQGALPGDKLTVPLATKEISTGGERPHDPGIIIDLTKLELYLFNGIDLIKTYRIGAGQKGHETPTGMTKITKMRKNPAWINPAPDSWGKNLPKRVEPGRTNPLGLRAMNLTFPAIRIHGITNPNKIGVYGSHGCINMINDDVVDLFDRVDVNTPVYIHY